MHWNFQYLKDRIKEKNYRKRNQGLPWLTQDAIKILQSFLTKDDVMLELGSGRSTVWFAENCKHITSIENNKEWYEKIKKTLEEKNLTNVDYHYKGINDEKPYESDYVKSIDTFGPESLDVVLVDGWYRAECAIMSIPKIKKAGILIIDNINWYVENQSNAPSSLHDKSEQLSDWNKFEDMVKGWRRIWTDNGVSSTAFYIKTS